MMTRICSLVLAGHLGLAAVSLHAEEEVDVKFLLVARQTPSTSASTCDPKTSQMRGTSELTCDPNALPGRICGVDLNEAFVLELWASDVGSNNTGIVAAYVDLAFDITVLNVDGLVHSSSFASFVEGEIDKETGRVVNFGGTDGTFTGQGVAPMWAKIGHVKMTAISVGAADIVSSPGLGGIGVFARPPPPASEIWFGTATVRVPRCTCRPSSPPETEKPKSPSNRFLSIRAGDPKQIQAIRVRFVSLPPPFNIWNDMDFWVGQPREACENSGKGLETDPADCPASLPTDRFWAAPLVCKKAEAHYMDWHGQCVAGTCVGGLDPGKACVMDDDCQVKVSLYHEGIVPSDPDSVSAIYDVQVIDEGCPEENEEDYSLPLTMIQSRWGDVCGLGPGGACTGQADEVLDVTNDVLGVLDKFANVSNLHKVRADLEPGDDWITGGSSNGPDFKVNVANDVLYALAAFGGAPYPFGPREPCGPGLAEGGE